MVNPSNKSIEDQNTATGVRPGPTNIGLDVGGTKTEIKRSDLPGTYRYPTASLSGIEAALENELTFAPPRELGSVAVGMLAQKTKQAQSS